MREFKFREWHQNHMRYWDEIGFFHLYILNDGKGIFEQYTGLHNDDGAELYEGDILLDTDTGYIVGAVEYREDCFWCGDYGLIDCIDCQVVGNIHENPELLEVDQ